MINIAKEINGTLKCRDGCDRCPRDGKTKFCWRVPCDADWDLTMINEGTKIKKTIASEWCDPMDDYLTGCLINLEKRGEK